MTDHALAYAVRPQVVLKYLGQLFIVLACLTSVPYLVSVYFGDYVISVRYGLIILLLTLSGLLFVRLPTPKRIQTNEALVLVATIFLLTPIVMSYPMTASGIPYEDALFEAISAGTTTGLSALGTVEGKPPTFLFARAWMQWYGGLGILVFALAIMIQPGRLTKSLAAIENSQDDLIGGTRAHAQYALIVYAGLTVVGIGLLLLCGAGFFNSVLYSFSSVSTGGFAPHDASLGDMDGQWRRIVVIFLCIGGSISFVFYRQLYWKGLSVIKEDRQTQGVIVACLLASLFLGLSMWYLEDRPLSFIMSNAPMIGISAQTTAGFTTMDIGELSGSSKLILIISMAVGGGVGSTAGGFKIVRLLIAFKLVSLFLSRSAMAPTVYTPRRLGAHKLETQEIEEALYLILLFIAIITLSWLPFVAAGYDPLDSLFEVVSATGTVGLSTGVVSSELPSYLKGIICADMLLGRLEIMAWLVLVYPRTWLGRRHYPRDARARRNS